MSAQPAFASNTGNPSTQPQGIPGLCATAMLLATLLDQETQLIHAMKLREIGPLQPEKARLTALCGTIVKSIDPSAPVAPGLKEKWLAVSKRLGEAAIENEMALRVGHAATDRLVSAIVGHIEGRQKAATGYGRPVHARAPAAKRPLMAGVAVDRQL
jgi:hypothetical protein